MKTTILSFSWLLLGACGGKGAVDLGGNVGNAGWADTRGSVATATTATTKATAVPQTLYDGDFVRAIAVDETTIAAAIQGPTDNHIDICQLADCQRTLQTIYRESFDECGDSGHVGPSPFEQLLISHGEVIWPACNSAGGSRYARSVMACATSGCPEGARQIAHADSICGLAASGEWVYWWNSGSDSGIARCPRAGCDVPEYRLAPIWIDPDACSMNSQLRLVADEQANILYMSGGTGIARIPSDFSTAVTPFYADPESIYAAPGRLRGLAVAGEHVYFALSTLTGQILRCPTAGCEQGPELVTSAPRWPTGPLADESAVYWLSQAQTNFVKSSVAIDGVISAFALDGMATGGVEVARLESLFTELSILRDPPSRSVMNSHHLYWWELGGPKSDSFKNAIRMVER